MNLVAELLRLFERAAARPESRWLVVLVALWIVVRVVARLLREREPKPSSSEPTEATVDLERLSLPLPVDGAASPLRLYHLPARLALVVVAPLGRESEVVEVDCVPVLLDRSVPGLGRLFDRTRPKTVVWPVQVSAAGFARRLATWLTANGRSLKNSPWTVVVGRSSADDRHYLLGLVLRTEQPTQLEVVEVDSPYKWLDTVRLAEVS